MQQKIVEENMGLVGKVIKDKVHGLGQAGTLPFEDLYQIGCIGLCKAAVTDKGIGSFSTYAYRLIWNEICDSLVKDSKHNKFEITELSAHNPLIANCTYETINQSVIKEVFDSIEKEASDVVVRGMQALRFTLEGYSSSEIGVKMHANPGTVRMWMTKARRYMMAHPELQGMI